MWKMWSEHICASKHAKNISEQLWWTTSDDSFHGASVPLAQQTEKVVEIRMLSESVDTTTRKYGASQQLADYTHVLPVPCPPSEQFMPLLQGHCKPVISRRWKVMTGKKEAQRIIYTLLETQPITSRESISWKKPVSNTGLMPLLLENAHATAYSTVSWIWSRKLWNIWIQIRLLCWRRTNRSPQ